MGLPTFRFINDSDLNTWIDILESHGFQVTVSEGQIDSVASDLDSLEGPNPHILLVVKNGDASLEIVAVLPSRLTANPRPGALVVLPPRSKESRKLERIIVSLLTSEGLTRHS